MVDLTNLTDFDLDALRVAVLIEQERRSLIENAAERADDLSRRYLDAVGRTDGTEWVQPTGAHDAYPQGAVVTHDGKEWVSLTPANVWEPGVSGWREQAGDDPETGEPEVPEWVQPTGGHDAYNTGDRVTFEGAVYTSAIDGNVWSPTDYPAGWTKEA